MQISEAPVPSVQSDGPPPPPPPRRQTAAAGLSTATNDTPAQIARKPLGVATAEPKLPARSASSASHYSQKLKAAPPVAKKPAHLAGPISPASSSVSVGVDAEAAQQPQSVSSHPPSFGGNVSSASSIRSMASQNGAYPTQHRPPSMTSQFSMAGSSSVGVNRSGYSTPAPGAIGLVGLADARRQGLPERKPVVTGIQRASSQHQAQQQHQQQVPPQVKRRPTQQVDLLGDDGGMEMGGWEALKPT